MIVISGLTSAAEITDTTLRLRDKRCARTKQNTDKNGFTGSSRTCSTTERPEGVPKVLLSAVQLEASMRTEQIRENP